MSEDFQIEIRRFKTRLAEIESGHRVAKDRLVEIESASRDAIGRLLERQSRVAAVAKSLAILDSQIREVRFFLLGE